MPEMKATLTSPLARGLAAVATFVLLGVALMFSLVLLALLLAAGFGAWVYLRWIRPRRHPGASAPRGRGRVIDGEAAPVADGHEAPATERLPTPDNAIAPRRQD